MVRHHYYMYLFLLMIGQALAELCSPVDGSTCVYDASSTTLLSTSCTLQSSCICNDGCTTVMSVMSESVTSTIASSTATASSSSTVSSPSSTVPSPSFIVSSPSFIVSSSTVSSPPSSTVSSPPSSTVSSPPSSTVSSPSSSTVSSPPSSTVSSPSSSTVSSPPYFILPSSVHVPRLTPTESVPPSDATTPFPLAIPIGAAVGGGVLAIVILLIIIIVVCVCRIQVNRQGFYETNEDKVTEPTMLRYSASLRSLTSQTVIPIDGRPAAKENEFYV